MKIFICFVLVCFLYSCGNKMQENSGNANDSLSVKENQAGNYGVAEKFPISLVDTFYKDSTTLAASFVRESFKKMDIVDESDWELRAFFKIDSLKSTKKYEAYVSSLDLGQTKDAQAFIYDTINFQNQKIYLWGITHSSYEACPYYSGRSLYLTTQPEGQPITYSVRILDNSGGADAPVYQYTAGTCRMEAEGAIACVDTIVNGGETITEKGVEYEEIVKVIVERKYQIESTGRIKTLAINKSPERKEKKLLEQQ